MKATLWLQRYGSFNCNRKIKSTTSTASLKKKNVIAFEINIYKCKENFIFKNLQKQLVKKTLKKNAI